MKCNEYLGVIDEYIEGELGESDVHQVTMHMAACQECRHRYEALLREHRIYAQYLLDIEAAPALWDGLQAEITKVKTTRESRSWARLSKWFAGPFGMPHLRPALVASLALIAIGITLSAVRYMNFREVARRDNISQKSTSAGIPSPLPTSNPSANHVGNDREGNKEGNAKSADNTRMASTGTNVKRTSLVEIKIRQRSKTTNPNAESSRRELLTDETVRRTERQYLAAITVLYRDFDHRRAQLDPNAVAQVQSALGDIDRAIMDTRQAVREHPGDPVVVQYMMTAYAKKIEVLRQLIGL